jgi:hypothetical protein
MQLALEVSGCRGNNRIALLTHSGEGVDVDHNITSALAALGERWINT